jgi:very-short-patch-repair endonuclease
VSIDQLNAAGLTHREITTRVRTGRLHRLYRGVYAVGHVALTPRSRELAAVLACGPDALLSHRSAAALWGLLRSVPRRIEVTAPRSRGSRAGFVVHSSRRLHPDDRELVDAIPVTSVARTLVDLAEVLAEPRLADAVHEAEVKRLFDLRALEAALARLPGRAGGPRLRRVLAAYERRPFTRSEAERRLLALCRNQGVPRPRVNNLVEGYELDFYWPEARLAVEVDGAAVHDTRRAFREDRRRDRALATKGIQVLRVPPGDLGERFAAELRAVLARRRWRSSALEEPATRGR